MLRQAIDELQTLHDELLVCAFSDLERAAQILKARGASTVKVARLLRTENPTDLELDRLRRIEAQTRDLISGFVEFRKQVYGEICELQTQQRTILQMAPTHTLTCTVSVVG